MPSSLSLVSRSVTTPLLGATLLLAGAVTLCGCSALTRSQEATPNLTATRKTQRHDQPTTPTTTRPPSTAQGSGRPSASQPPAGKIPAIQLTPQGAGRLTIDSSPEAAVKEGYARKLRMGCYEIISPKGIVIGHAAVSGAGIVTSIQTVGRADARDFLTTATGVRVGSPVALVMSTYPGIPKYTAALTDIYQVVTKQSENRGYEMLIEVERTTQLVVLITSQRLPEPARKPDEQPASRYALPAVC